MNISPYRKIVETIGSKPSAYATTGIPFWDDEHISKSMLALHLDPDVDSASRTHAFMDTSIVILSIKTISRLTITMNTI